MPLKDKITSIVTGDAYKHPAKTETGAFTKQGEPNAHTIEGTSADPNSTGSKAGDMLEQGKEKASQAKNESGNSSGGLKDKVEGKAKQEGVDVEGAKGKAQEVKGDAQRNL